MHKLAPIIAVIVVAGLFAIATGQAPSKAVVDGPTHDGHELTVDLAASQQFKNVGSKKDGAGMCVNSSIEMAARAQGLEQIRGFRDWTAANFGGGSWPDNVDKQLAAWFKHKGITPVPYVQYEGKEPQQVMELVDRTGRMACITYGWGERYGSSIAHMVCSPAYHGKYGVVLDNNFVAKKTANGWDENIYEWMDKAELCRRMKLGTGAAWIFVWLPPPPPPPARNFALPKEGKWS